MVDMLAEKVESLKVEREEAVRAGDKDEVQKLDGMILSTQGRITEIAYS